MSSTPQRLAAFALVLAALFGAGALAGQLFDPDAPGGDAEAHDAEAGSMNDTEMNASHENDRAAADERGGARGPADNGGAHQASSGRGSAEPEHGGGQKADPVRGLAVAENGLRLVVDDPELRRGAEETLRFRIVERDGETVRDFDVEHTKRMHAIVVRRDLTGFQHLHPTQSSDGVWTLPLSLDAAGDYRLYADFSHAGEVTTLATDLRVDGSADLRELPKPTSVATSDGGYEVLLDAAEARPGEEADLRFSASDDGRPVEIEPYLGAGGHLVALREGDLAFLHVHPTEDHELRFAATFPTAGRYRLFLQFKVEGRLHTVAFTHEVG